MEKIYEYDLTAIMRRVWGILRLWRLFVGQLLRKIVAVTDSTRHRAHKSWQYQH